MSDDMKPYAATPAATLEQHITDPCVPKNEAEWWAYREIERLRAELAAERERAKGFETQWEIWEEEADKASAERDALRAELAAEREKSRNAEKAWECALQERNEMQSERDRAEARFQEKSNAVVALYAQLEEAREALEQFARAVECYASAATDEYPIDRGEFALGDLRRARAVLDKIKGDGDE